MLTRLNRAARQDDDAGFGLVLVIGLMTFMMIMVTVIIGMTQESLKGAGRHNKFDAALSSAESGVDQTLARLQRAYVVYGEDFEVPTPTGESVDTSPVCSGAAVTSPSSFASGTAERTWALQQIAAEVSANSSCIQHSSSGDYAILKAAGRQTVYAQGWSPSYGAKNATTRLIKAEYLFAPYAPSDAVLTGCNLELDSSTNVQTAGSGDPTLAAVHSNCKVTVAGGNPTVTGPVSSTDTSSASSNNFQDNPGHSVTTTPAEDVPTVTAREVWAQNALQPQYTSSWYDMCPDGTVRQPTSAGPCASSAPVYATMTKGVSSFRGFQWEGTTNSGTSSELATWNLVGQAGDGTYYFQHANETQGTGVGNVSSNAVTIIASADDTTSCPKIGGNIYWNLNDISAPRISHLFMFADADLTTDHNFHAGGISGNTVISGMFIAGDQINMQTSSNGAFGSVIAEDTCQNSGPVTSNVIKNPDIFYDPNAQAPFTSIIDTTLWLELNK